MAQKVKFLVIVAFIFLVPFLLAKQTFDKNLSHNLSKKIEEQIKVQKQVAIAKELQKQNLTHSNNQTQALKSESLKQIKPIETTKNKKFSDLDLELLETIKIANNKLATIRLAEKTNTYQEKQSINSEIKLLKIADNFVVINYLNQKHQLNLTEQIAQNKTQIVDLVHHPKPLFKERIKKYQKMLTQDPYALIGVIKISRYQQNGVNGFELNPNIDKKLFNELGLKQGDVVLAINQLPISNGLNAKEIYNTLKSKDNFIIKLLRDSEVIEYQLNLSS